MSGNAITEALVFGERAGYFAAAAAGDDTGWSPVYAEPARAELETLRQRKGIGPAPGAVQLKLQDLMWEHAGPFRSGEGLERAAAAICDLREQLPDLTISEGDVFNLDVQDYYELRAMLRSAEAVVASALQRVESRGAHQRLDAPQMSPAFEKNQLVSLDGRTGPTTPALCSRWRSVVRSEVRSA